MVVVNQGGGEPKAPKVHGILREEAVPFETRAQAPFPLHVAVEVR